MTVKANEDNYRKLAEFYNYRDEGNDYHSYMAKKKEQEKKESEESQNTGELQYFTE
jgi:hypothetical protein